MKRIIKVGIVLAACFSIGACKSKEDKALALIDKQMFSSLYDYESYQPVETQLDSAFNVAEYNEEILALGLLVSDDMDEVNDEIKEMKSAQRSMNIWSDSYSSYGRSEYYEARDAMKEHWEKAKTYGQKVALEMGMIREKAKEFDGSFCGWKVTHKFRCKTKGGNSTLGTYVYIFDRDVKEILYYEDTEDEDIVSAKKLIKEAIEMTEEEYKEFASTFEDKE